jgi:hypothetical protein
MQGNSARYTSEKSGNMIIYLDAVVLLLLLHLPCSGHIL